MIFCFNLLEPFKCDECTESTATEHHLKQHINAKHKGTAKRPRADHSESGTHRCIFCARGFLNVGHLKRHLGTHGDKVRLFNLEINVWILMICIFITG